MFSIITAILVQVAVLFGQPTTSSATSDAGSGDAPTEIGGSGWGHDVTVEVGGSGWGHDVAANGEIGGSGWGHDVAAEIGGSGWGHDVA